MSAIRTASRPTGTTYEVEVRVVRRCSCRVETEISDRVPALRMGLCGNRRSRSDATQTSPPMRMPPPRIGPQATRIMFPQIASAGATTPRISVSAIIARERAGSVSPRSVFREWVFMSLLSHTDIADTMMVVPFCCQKSQKSTILDR